MPVLLTHLQFSPITSPLVMCYCDFCVGLIPSPPSPNPRIRAPGQRPAPAHPRPASTHCSMAAAPSGESVLGSLGSWVSGVPPRSQTLRPPVLALDSNPSTDCIPLHHQSLCSVFKLNYELLEGRDFTLFIFIAQTRCVADIQKLYME